MTILDMKKREPRVHWGLVDQEKERPARLVRCLLMDVEGKRHAVPKVWCGACAEDVRRKMLHVKCWVPFIVREVIEVEVIEVEVKG